MAENHNGTRHMWQMKIWTILEKKLPTLYLLSLITFAIELGKKKNSIRSFKMGQSINASFIILSFLRAQGGAFLIVQIVWNQLYYKINNA